MEKLHSFTCGRMQLSASGWIYSISTPLSLLYSSQPNKWIWTLSLPLFSTSQAGELYLKVYIMKIQLGHKRDLLENFLKRRGQNQKFWKVRGSLNKNLTYKWKYLIFNQFILLYLKIIIFSYTSKYDWKKKEPWTWLDSD